MGTLGLVTIIRADKVRMKIVAGCNGMEAKTLADALRKMPTIPSLEEAYELAVQSGFCCPGHLVVINESDSYDRLDEDWDEVSSNLYRQTFDQPEFNPRWIQGISDYTEVVHK